MCSGRIHFSADRSPPTAAFNRVCIDAMACSRGVVQLDGNEQTHAI